jgi:hypothetical protein
MAEFDIERFVSLSRKVDLSDVDFDEAARVGISDEDHRVLRYMADTELHTILYLRDLLAGHTKHDAEVTQFMACWVYEETHHGRALDQFMAAVGRGEASRYERIEARPTFREELTGVLSRFGARMSPHFAAAHMCWGAINELTAAASYLALARRTRNQPLATLVTKLAKDERKHFAFYYSQAERRLRDGGWRARRLCRLVIEAFWKPVGIGVGDPNTLEFISSYLMADARGQAEIRAIDETIRRLPGMEWFHMVGEWVEGALVRYRDLEPDRYEAHRERERAEGEQAAA